MARCRWRPSPRPSSAAISAICAPSRLRLDALRSEFVRGVERHPRARDLTSGRAVYAALADIYPCRDDVFGSGSMFGNDSLFEDDDSFTPPALAAS